MNARVDMKINQAELAIAVEKSFAAPNYAPIPVVLDRGEGSWLWDADGKRYLDFMSAYSAVSHGHAHPRLVAALTDQAQTRRRHFARVSLDRARTVSRQAGRSRRSVEARQSTARQRRRRIGRNRYQGSTPLGLSSQRHR